MSISREAEATRAVLKLHRDDAINGMLTLGDVVYLVRQVMPGAEERSIYNAINAYGPMGEGPDGEGDLTWYRRVQQTRIPSWFYNPNQEKD